MTTSVKTGSRIHCSLLDLGSATDRAYGGAGFMIEGPEIRVSAAQSSQWDVTSALPIDMRTRNDIEKMFERLARYTEGGLANLHIESLPPQHVGLGTKTGLLLASLVAIKEELGINLDTETLQLLSSRGGTSGVGIHGFFTGGFIVDAGHPQKEIGVPLPSSRRHPTKPPLRTVRLSIPSSWRFHLVLPKGTVWEGSTETKFFADNTPIPKSEVYEVISIIYHGLVPAIHEGNIRGLRHSLARLQSIGFKARELSAQSNEVQQAYQALRKIPSAAIGLSSMGPLLYVVLESTDKRGVEIITHVSKETDSIYLGAFPGLTQEYNSLS